MFQEGSPGGAALNLRRWRAGGGLQVRMQFSRRRAAPLHSMQTPSQTSLRCGHRVRDVQAMARPIRPRSLAFALRAFLDSGREPGRPLANLVPTSHPLQTNGWPRDSRQHAHPKRQPSAARAMALAMGGFAAASPAPPRRRTEPPGSLHAGQMHVCRPATVWSQGRSSMSSEALHCSRPAMQRRSSQRWLGLATARRTQPPACRTQCGVSKQQPPPVNA